MARPKSKRAKRAPTGRMIDAGSVTMVAGSDVTAGREHRNRRETRQRAVEEFEKLMPHLPLPQPMAAIVANCARAGMYLRQGKGRAFLRQEDKVARETALKEASHRLPQYRAKAKAEGKPRSWPREQAARYARGRMRELGVASPPSIQTILKSGLRSR